MKTDPVEIFQTIRAALQPYATLGFSNRENSDAAYDLWSDKNINDAGKPRNETFFASVNIVGEQVMFYTGFESHIQNNNKDIRVEILDDLLINQIEDALAAGYKIYKEKEWV